MNLGPVPVDGCRSACLRRTLNLLSYPKPRSPASCSSAHLLHIMSALGIWSQMNAISGSLIDIGEEEEILPQLLPNLKSGIETALARVLRGREDGFEFEIGKQTAPTAKRIVVRVGRDEIVDLLTRIAKFVDEAIAHHKSVLIAP